MTNFWVTYYKGIEITKYHIGGNIYNYKVGNALYVNSMRLARKCINVYLSAIDSNTVHLVTDFMIRDNIDTIVHKPVKSKYSWVYDNKKY